MKYKNNFQDDGLEVVTRNFDSDPVDTRSECVQDHGAEGRQEYNVEENKVVAAYIKPYIKFVDEGIEDIFKGRKFSSVKEAEDFYKSFIKDLDEVFLKYERS
jgi:hypothetical protein